MRAGQGYLDAALPIVRAFKAACGQRPSLSYLAGYITCTQLPEVPGTPPPQAPAPATQSVLMSLVLKTPVVPEPSGWPLPLSDELIPSHMILGSVREDVARLIQADWDRFVKLTIMPFHAENPSTTTVAGVPQGDTGYALGVSEPDLLAVHVVPD